MFVAEHEAAHVVVAWRSGTDVDRVSIDWTREQSRAEVGHEHFDAGTSHQMGTFRENALVALAGLVVDENIGAQLAERGIMLTYELPGGIHGDENTAKVMAFLEAKEDRTVAATMIAPWWAEASELVFQRVEEIHAVRDALLGAGVLKREDLERLLGSLPAVEPTTEAERSRCNVEYGAWAARQAKRMAT